MTAKSADIAVTRPVEMSIVHLVMRLALMLLGAALCASAFGLWLVPAASAVPELSLMKLGLSLFMLISGLCCLVLAKGAQKS
ncbi:MAG: hypothetical protein QNJ09_06815 [Paracoccaceae bacterium]|nr:hypothetical protein [Paracoccaceae bacterium]